jgi:hypothetical protein
MIHEARRLASPGRAWPGAPADFAGPPVFLAFAGLAAWLDVHPLLCRNAPEYGIDLVRSVNNPNA